MAKVTAVVSNPEIVTVTVTAEMKLWEWRKVLETTSGVYSVPLEELRSSIRTAIQSIEKREIFITEDK